MYYEDYDVVLTVHVKKRDDWSANPRAESTVRIPLQDALNEIDKDGEEGSIFSTARSQILDVITKSGIYPKENAK